MEKYGFSVYMVDAKTLNIQAGIAGLKGAYLSSNSGHLDQKARKIGVFWSFLLLREIVLRFIFKHFPYIPRIRIRIEIPAKL